MLKLSLHGPWQSFRAAGGWGSQNF